jgi:hypothetical protein
VRVRRREIRRRIEPDERSSALRPYTVTDGAWLEIAPVPRHTARAADPRPGGSAALYLPPRFDPICGVFRRRRDIFGGPAAVTRAKRRESPRFCPGSTFAFPRRAWFSVDGTGGARPRCRSGSADRACRLPSTRRRVVMRGFALVVSIALLSSTASAGVVYSQPPSNTGTVYQSSWWEPDGTDYDQWVWDDFTLGTTTDLTEIDWRGGYLYGGSYSGPVLGFDVDIYPSIPAGIQPDVVNPPLAHFSVAGNANETPAGSFGGTALFDYRFVLPTPFHAVAGTKYWIQIEAAHHGIPEWGFAQGTGGTGSYFRRIHYVSDIYYQTVPGDTCFTLIAADASPWPGSVDTGAGGAGPVDVLTIDGAGGGASRIVELHSTDPLVVRIAEPPSRTGLGATYAVYVWAREPLPGDATALPHGVGTIGLPTPLNRLQSPQPVKIANVIGHAAQLGTTNWPGPAPQRAPFRLLNLLAGVGPSRIGLHLFFQGIVQDDRSAGTVHFSVTNGFVLRTIP